MSAAEALDPFAAAIRLMQSLSFPNPHTSLTRHCLQEFRAALTHYGCQIFRFPDMWDAAREQGEQLVSSSLKILKHNADVALAFDDYCKAHPLTPETTQDALSKLRLQIANTIEALQIPFENKIQPKQHQGLRAT